MTTGTMTERRITWRLNDDPPPDDWRMCISWFLEDGTRDTLYTNAPADESPYNHAYRFVNYRPVYQVRTVTDWEDEKA